MKPWIETRKFWYVLDEAVEDEARGENWRMRRITPDRGGFDRWLDTLVTELNAGQWEIKAMLPLSRGRAYQEIAPLREPTPTNGKRSKKDSPVAEVLIGESYGLGWGVASTWSVCVVAQRTTWLSDEAYDAKLNEWREAGQQVDRVQRRDGDRQHNVAIEAEIAPLLMERERLAQAPIAFKKVLIGKSGYQFKDQRYATQQEAEAARTAEIAALDARITGLRDRLRPLLDD